MLKRTLLAILLITISLCLFSNVEKGVIDLSNYDFNTDEPLDLSGEWILKQDNRNDIFSNVPGGWIGHKGEVTYIINIISSGAKRLIIAPSQINSKYKLFHNGIQIASDDQNRPRYIPIELINGINKLEFNITNYTDVFSGFRNHPYIGNFNTMMRKHERNILKDTFFSGASFIMFIFFVVLFLHYKKDRSMLYFALICINFAVRSFVTNDKVIFYYLPNLSYDICNKLEYLTIYILPLLLLLFLYNYFKKAKKDKLFLIFTIISIVYPLSALLFTPALYMKLSISFYIYICIFSVYIIIKLVFYTINRYRDSLKLSVSLLCLCFAGIYDINIIFNSSSVTLILPGSMIIFIMFMSFIVSKREIDNTKQIEKLSSETLKVNKYLSKFVPNHFIETVGMGNILEIKKGDGMEKDMTVLFASIKNFKKDLKLYNPEESVELLNRCFSVISPIISSNNGFIDKFIDETLMAVFPGKPEDAIDAIIQINIELKMYNSSNSEDRPIEIRSGIHIGKQFIGIVGDDKRVDATVISKVVNTASRINSFTNKIDRNILISDDVYQRLSNKNGYETKFMGKVKLKGNKNFIGIHCIYIDDMDEADNLFSMTMTRLGNSSLDKIENVLLNIKSMYKDHTPSLYYLELIQRNKTLEDIEK
ncbi:MAG: adenylate/guanylate cyclase domain-containing protein [Spirochaetaceae bacterium]